MEDPQRSSYGLLELVPDPDLRGVFNLLSACVGIALTPLFVRFVESLSGDADVGRKIAHAPMIFNGLGVAVVLPFLSPIARPLERVLPERAPR